LRRGEMADWGTLMVMKKLGQQSRGDAAKVQMLMPI
jgi:hypothetical protein